MSAPPLVVRPIAVEQTRALRQAILRPHQTFDELATDEVPGSFAVGAFFSGERLVCVGLVTPGGPPEGWRVRGMATLAEARGLGAGSAVLALLLAYAWEHGAGRVWCSARSPARSLYERAGFRVVSDEHEVPLLGPHFVMEVVGGAGERQQ